MEFYVHPGLKCQVFVDKIAKGQCLVLRGRGHDCQGACRVGIRHITEVVRQASWASGSGPPYIKRLLGDD
jgi:hypothetical protein